MALPLTREGAERYVETVNECYGEGFTVDWHPGAGNKTATAEASERLGVTLTGLKEGLKSAKRKFALEPDPSLYVPKRAADPFTVEDLPDDGEPTAEDLIEHLAARHATKKAHHDAAKLRKVQVNIEGPIGIAFFGDPHIDDPGCAWGDLKRDVETVRDTPGMLAVNVGDTTNNWVGRLMKLYADQEVTSKQALRLIEWFMTALPWLIDKTGNHDAWNTEKGDPAEVMHRLYKRIGVMEDGSTRLELNLPGGATCRIHVRHDFPGGSQFNPAHAMVRETLFGYRDHIMACGHRHTAGYIPVWHNDPRRLCHGLRVGTYKDFDHYAREKGFQDGNWARAMAAVIDPEYADDPVRFVKVFFSLDEAAEYLTWRRARWSLAKAA